MLQLQVLQTPATVNDATARPAGNLGSSGSSEYSLDPVQSTDMQEGGGQSFNAYLTEQLDVSAPVDLNMPGLNDEFAWAAPADQEAVEVGVGLPLEALPGEQLLPQAALNLSNIDIETGIEAISEELTGSSPSHVSSLLKSSSLSADNIQEDLAAQASILAQQDEARELESTIVTTGMNSAPSASINAANVEAMRTTAREGKGGLGDRIISMGDLGQSRFSSQSADLESFDEMDLGFEESSSWLRDPKPNRQALSESLIAKELSSSDSSFKSILEGVAEEVESPVVSTKPVALSSQPRALNPVLNNYTTTIPVPVGDQQWGQNVSEKIVWLAQKEIQFAEIHLNPADLGPMEVKISVQNDQASITFSSQNANVRELLELNVNRLRDLLDENGVELSQFDVSDQQPQEHAFEDREDSTEAAGAMAESEHDAEVLAEGEVAINSDQQTGIDYYA